MRQRDYLPRKQQYVYPWMAINHLLIKFVERRFNGSFKRRNARSDRNLVLRFLKITKIHILLYFISVFISYRYWFGYLICFMSMNILHNNGLRTSKNTKTENIKSILGGKSSYFCHESCSTSKLWMKFVGVFLNWRFIIVSS